MCWKILYVSCVVFLQLVNIFECFPYSGAVVRLSCAVCRLDPTDCCFGTLIAPNVAITTAYCARYCQYIAQNTHIIPIFNTHLPVQNDVLKPNSQDNVAIIDFNNSTNSNLTYVNISAVEPSSVIGQNATVPMVSDQNMYLKQAMILPCQKRYAQIKGFYICTDKTFGELFIFGERQGLPLLVNDSVVGISCVSDSHLTQDAFIALAPLLSWIEMVASNKSQGKPEKLLNFKTAVRAARYNKMKMRRALSPAEENQQWNYTSGDATLHSCPSIIIERTKLIVSNKTENLDSPKSDQNDEVNILYNIRLNSSDYLQKSQFENGIDNNILRIANRNNVSTSASSSTTAEELIQTPSTVTNLMDWFRMARTSIDTSPLVLVLVTKPGPIIDIENVNPKDPAPKSAFETTRLKFKRTSFAPATTTSSPSSIANFLDLT